MTAERGVGAASRGRVLGRDIERLRESVSGRDGSCGAEVLKVE